MAQSTETFGQEALQFVGELDRVSTMEAVAERMSAITSRFGFEGLFIGGHKAHPSLTFNELLLATRCPPEFQPAVISESLEHAGHNCVKELPKTKWATRKRLEVGRDIPEFAEIKRIINAASPDYRTLLLTAAMTGMRASELRGMRWSDVNLKAGEIHVRQRADKRGKIRSPKSLSGTRTIPLPACVIEALRNWQPNTLNLSTGTSDGLVFPGKGKPLALSSIIRVGLIPAVRKAGLLTECSEDTRSKEFKDERGMVPKYTGLHCLRHFYASWCINRKEEGGMGLPVKVVQERLGHSNATMTLNVYSHLFPKADDAKALNEAAAKLFA